MVHNNFSNASTKYELYKRVDRNIFIIERKGRKQHLVENRIYFFNIIPIPYFIIILYI